MNTQTPADTTSEQLEQKLSAAAAAAPALAASSPPERAGWIRAAADALDASADELVPPAVEESHLAEPRLRGEVARSSGQLRLFADALESGALLEVIIDTADPDAKPVPRPDLRRMLLPVGPVLVYAASNFPFAFSVSGGDTAAGLAAGCPVVVKAHPGHPTTSQRTYEVMADALRKAGAPEGVLGLVLGTDVGVQALRDPRIRAAGFTGSVPGGLALHAIATTRPDPIPFYGELGSINPAFVTEAAVRARGDEIAAGFISSYTLGVGQFCTKPGVLFLPAGHGLEEKLLAAGEVAAAPMLYPGIGKGFSAGLERLRKLDGVETLVGGDAEVEDTAGTRPVAASLLRTTVPTLLADPEAILEECFGPVSVIVEYADRAELHAAAEAMIGSLTATVHAEESDHEVVGDLLPLLTARAGRVVWNGWPTGVAVSWAMHHGGPFPSTVGSVHTSVGTTAARRFQRPVSYQDTPQALLPPILRDANRLRSERRINGEMSRDDVRR
jgi:NADP-dependent aldehyde dehydrogenase